MNQKSIRIEIENRPYLIFKDPDIEEGTMSGSFDRVLLRFRVAEADTPGDMVGCILFTLGLLSAYSWETEEETNYGKKELREFALANLLPHIPFGIQNLTDLFGQSLKCLILAFSQENREFIQEDQQYRVQLKDSFLKTAQRLFFPNGMTKKDVQIEILKILRNHRENYPQTSMLYEELEASIPLSSKSLVYNLGVLEEEGKISLNKAPHSDPPKTISVVIRVPGINALEGDEAGLLQRAQSIKQVFGTNIENLSTHGDNSPININISDIKTIIKNISKIVEAKDFSNKNEVLPLLKEVGEEMEKGKDPKKIKNILENIKSKATWVYNLIFQNPVLTAYLTQLLLKTI